LRVGGDDWVPLGGIDKIRSEEWSGFCIAEREDITLSRGVGYPRAKVFVLSIIDLSLLDCNFSRIIIPV
jgi:hypothetical protein